MWKSDRWSLLQTTINGTNVIANIYLRKLPLFQDFTRPITNLTSRVFTLFGFFSFSNAIVKDDRNSLKRHLWILTIIMRHLFMSHNLWLYFFFYPSPRKTERKANLQSLPNPRTGEGVPLQSLPDAQEKNRGVPRPEPHRAAGEDLVSEQEDEVEKGEQQRQVSGSERWSRGRGRGQRGRWRRRGRRERSGRERGEQGVILWSFLWLYGWKRRKRAPTNKQKKSHKEAESVNFMTTLSFCHKAAKISPVSLS